MMRRPVNDLAYPNQTVAAAGSSRLRERLQRVIASVSLIVVFGAVYAVAPYNQEQLDHLYEMLGFSFTGRQFFALAAAGYACGVLIYHMLVPCLGSSKSVRCLRVARAFIGEPISLLRRGLEREERIALLATLLKGFFAPLMVMSLMIFCVAAASHGLTLVEGRSAGVGLLALFDQHGFWMLMQTILFIDVLIFTTGYLIEIPRLGNEIRSVDPTVLGWTAALLCYPPFNALTSRLLGAQVSDFPQFDNPTVHVVLNVALLALLACYAWASVALGLKASNRGIVRRGPYAFVRHPAYVCKNLAWWIGAAPLVSSAFDQGLYDGISAIVSAAGWSMLYVLRALTEEDHLRGVDHEYALYAEQVRYRFVPGIC
jgi:protein-S-isoprenylcysteine O-methyltransferase Ste14